MPRASDVNRRYFREAYRTGVHGWETDQPSVYAIDFLRQLAQLLPGGSMLDIGCGEGRHAIAAAKLGFRVAGIDAGPATCRSRRVDVHFVPEGTRRQTSLPRRQF